MASITHVTTIEQPLANPDLKQWLDRVRDEYHELPGLNLTPAQMQRLWGLEPHVCSALIESLVAAHVLRRGPTGKLVVYEE